LLDKFDSTHNTY